jgi:hypothetical protein
MLKPLLSSNFSLNAAFDPSANIPAGYRVAGSSVQLTEFLHLQ